MSQTATISNPPRRAFFTSVFALSVAALVSQLSEIIDQYYTGILSPAHLNLHNSISTFSMSIAVIGGILGFSTLILGSKHRENASELSWSGLFISALAAPVAVIVQLVIADIIFRTGAQISEGAAYLHIYTVANGLSIILATAASVLALYNDRNGIIFLAVVTGLVNVFGNEVSIHFCANTGEQFVGIALATFVAKTAGVVVALYRMKRIANTFIVRPIKFLRDARVIILGEFAWIFTLNTVPFVVMYIMNHSFSVDQANASAMGYRFGRICLTPWFAAAPLTLKAVASNWNNFQSRQLAGQFEHRNLVALSTLTLIVGAVAISINTQSREISLGAFALAPIFAHLIAIHSHRDTVILKVSGNSHIGATIDILAALFVTFPLLILGGMTKSPVLAASIAYLAPAAFRVGVLRNYAAAALKSRDSIFGM